MCTPEVQFFAARPSQNAPPLMTCNMNLDLRFAEMLKTYIPCSANTAALSSGMAQAPGSISIEQMGGFSVRIMNEPSDQEDVWMCHSLGMAIEIHMHTALICPAQSGVASC